MRILVFGLLLMLTFSACKNTANFSDEFYIGDEKKFFSNSIFSHEDKKFKDSIIEHVSELLSDDWFIEETENGFKVYFCRSCYKAYLDNNKVDPWPNELSRSDFFSLDKIDSVCYFNTIGISATDRNITESARIKEHTQRYRPNNIMSFEVQFEPKWEQKKYDSIQHNNDLVKEEIYKEPVYKTSLEEFSDYRFWLPDEYFKSRTTDLGFYFQRLPYSSETIPYSVFIIQDKPFFFAKPVYVDRTDPKYFDNRANFIEAERVRTLKIIALALGVYDFKVIN